MESVLIMYVIKRINQRGGYVAQTGTGRSYTHNLAKAKVYETRQKAELDLCPENEIILYKEGEYTR
jgi:phage protein U